MKDKSKVAGDASAIHGTIAHKTVPFTRVSSEAWLRKMGQVWEADRPTARREKGFSEIIAKMTWMRITLSNR